ncbi:SDR family NAD(P)-dependent oxidoreductase [Novosphingobium sp. AP12]|uniref:SDR family NAD(P)-dependent oxidoreductase n=1 Tax=Novosphingobium sp. AP12 TaxID=1144305 RepID=UPI000271DD18|nr:SDR family NAD(P)-dependent oxidoreductase [Novosphingobium sp. AP12]EJL33462.1 short-chain alcohol dehydrogenase [Novosphingobium sp. AP12]
MDLHMNGKTALVTGASQGLGRAIVKALAAEGVTVFATARNSELLASLANEVPRAAPGPSCSSRTS